MNAQIKRNMSMAGLPVAVSEGKFTGRLTLTQHGHALDFYGGDGKVRRLQAIPFTPKTRKPYERRNGRCLTIRPRAS